MSCEGLNHSEQDLDPWQVVLGCLLEQNSYDIPRVIDKTGMEINWFLNRDDGHSHRTRITAYRPRIDAAYKALSTDGKLRVDYIVVEQLAQMGLSEELNSALNKIGWRLDGGKLAPGSGPVLELFFPPESQHDAYVRIREIFQRATQSIRVIDPYLDATIFKVLGSIQGSLKIELLTGKTPTDFRLEADKFKQQYQMKIEIRRSKDFHDRFIIVDEEECWHIGCSIKDAGKRAFLMSRVEDQNNAGSLKDALNKSWSGAKPV